MTALYESLIARQQQFTQASKSHQGEYKLASVRNYATPIAKERVAYSTLDSVLDESGVDEKRMIARFVVSTMSPDRVGDIVPPESCIPLLHNYKANPVVFFNHEQIPFPVANSEVDGQFTFWPQPDKGRIVADAKFHGKTAESTVIFGLVACKALRTASLGFRPLQGKRIKGAGESAYNFTLIDVIEWSIVGVPCNSEAIAIGLGKGMFFGEKVTPILRKALTPYAVPLSGTVVGGYDAKGTPMKLHAIGFDKKFFDVAKATEFASQNGFDVSDLVDSGTMLEFHQVPLAKCSPIEWTDLLDIDTKSLDKVEGIGYAIYEKELSGDDLIPAKPEEKKKAPASALFVQKMSALVDEGLGVLNEHADLSERPAIKDFHQKGMEELGGYRKGLDEFIGKAYSDVDFTEQKEEVLKLLKGLTGVGTSIDTPSKQPDAPGEMSKPGVGLLTKMVECVGKAEQLLKQGDPTHDHPVVEEISKACMKELPKRKKEIVKLMKSEYKEAHDHLGWGKDPEDEPAGAASKPEAKDKDKKKAEGEKTTVTKTVDIDPSKVEIDTPKTNSGDPLGSVKAFLTDLVAAAMELAGKMGFTIDVKESEKNPYEKPVGQTKEEPKKEVVTKEEEDEDEAGTITKQQMDELTATLASISKAAEAQARQVSFLTGGKG